MINIKVPNRKKIIYFLLGTLFINNKSNIFVINFNKFVGEIFIEKYYN